MWPVGCWADSHLVEAVGQRGQRWGLRWWPGQVERSGVPEAEEGTGETGRCSEWAEKDHSAPSSGSFQSQPHE